MKIYNSLTRQIEDFTPLNPPKVGMYTCGMTVYDYAHIGHGRKYVCDDLLRRLLIYNGYEVNHVQNVTDVGHLMSDGDEGEDKMEKGAKKYKKTVWEVAEMYTNDFYEQMGLLNILRPTTICRATEHIEEQIKLIKRLSDKGFAYETPEAVYFDIGKFPRYENLFGLNRLDKRVAVRVEVQTGEHKKNPADFALWFKAVGRFSDHVMQWESPWGKGFPGWHIECSAMAIKYLGESFDIHTGGEDHLMIHHPNEIAQSEGATGKPFAKYWVHCGFLTVDGQKMSKSLGNVYQVREVIEKGFLPMALRYLYMTAHYRTPLNFTWSSLTAAQSAYEKLTKIVLEKKERVNLSKEKEKKIGDFKKRFWMAVNDDLGFPKGLAVIWEMVKSNIPDYDKADFLLDADAVLGLNLAHIKTEKIPEGILEMLEKRNKLRGEGKFVEADNLRAEIEKKGFKVNDISLKK